MPGTEYHNSRRATKSADGFGSAASLSKYLRLPSTIRDLFDAFPWITYEENALPQRSSVKQSVNTLHVFTHGDERFSPNPACLKWQMYLMIKGVAFNIVNSNNHASPTGALPFILPARKPTEPQPQAIVSSKIQRWVENQTGMEDENRTEDRVLMSLIEQNIRTAWLFFVYLKPENFQSVARILYICPASRNSLVQKSLAYQLKQAAQDEVMKVSTRIDGMEILASADRAFKTLEQTLKGHDFFSKSQEPGILDCAVFSYTYLISKFAQPQTAHTPAWTDDSLSKALSKYEGLIGHTKRMQDRCSAQD